MVLVSANSGVFSCAVATVLTTASVLILSAYSIISTGQVSNMLRSVLLGVRNFSEKGVELLMGGCSPTFGVSPSRVSNILRVPLMNVVPSYERVAGVGGNNGSIFFNGSGSTSGRGTFTDSVERVTGEVLRLSTKRRVTAIDISSQTGNNVFSSVFGHEWQRVC